jgi:hypothetical protein
MGVTVREQSGQVMVRMEVCGSPDADPLPSSISVRTGEEVWCKLKATGASVPHGKDWQYGSMPSGYTVTPTPCKVLEPGVEYVVSVLGIGAGFGRFTLETSGSVRQIQGGCPD